MGVNGQQASAAGRVVTACYHTASCLKDSWPMSEVVAAFLYI